MAKKLSKEYLDYIGSKQWKQGWRRKATLGLLGGRCVLCPVLRATQADHVTYRNLKRELPFRDLIPLSAPAHRLVTAVRSLARATLGRDLGGFVVAWFLRVLLLSEWFFITYLGVELWKILKP